MSFSVDTDALWSFRDLVGNLKSDAMAMDAFISENRVMSLHEEGLANRLAFGHEGIVRDMQYRVGMLRDEAGNSAKGVENTAVLYEEQEQDNAQTLDEAYPDAGAYEQDPDRAGEPDSAGKSGFPHYRAENALTMGDIPTKAEMMAHDVEDWARTGLDGISMIGLCRMVWENAVGFDLTDWIRKWYFGDWEGWARCVQMWKACAETTDIIAENLWAGIGELAETWQGRAFEDADTYFRQFRDAIYVEHDAFSALEKIYELIMEAIFEIHLLMNDVINTAVDLAIQIATLGTAGGIKAAIKAALSVGASNPVSTLINCVSSLGTLLTLASDVVKIVETVSSATDLPQVPACELEKFDPVGREYGYEYQEQEQPPTDVEGP